MNRNEKLSVMIIISLLLILVLFSRIQVDLEQENDLLKAKIIEIESQENRIQELETNIQESKEYRQQLEKLASTLDENIKILKEMLQEE